MNCKSCNKDCSGHEDSQSYHDYDVCKDCYRDPETNQCEYCGKKLIGIAYPYVCGPCFLHSSRG